MICVELATIEKKIWQVLFYWRNSACDTSLAQKSWMEWYHNSGHLKTSKFRKNEEEEVRGKATCREMEHAPILILMPKYLLKYFYIQSSFHSHVLQNRSSLVSWPKSRRKNVMFSTNLKTWEEKKEKKVFSILYSQHEINVYHHNPQCTALSVLLLVPG